MKKFPTTLYITRENEGEGEDEYLQPREELNEAAELGKERRVAVYELTEVVTLTTKVEARAGKQQSRKTRR